MEDLEIKTQLREKSGLEIRFIFGHKLCAKF
jgi:hypothetical protein